MPSLSELEPVVLEVLRQLAEREGNYIFCGKVKQGLKRRFPALDEQTLGFSSFKLFLQHFPDRVVFVDHLSGGHVALAESDEGGQAPATVGEGAGATASAT